MAINEIHHFEDTTVSIDGVKWNNMLFFDSTLDQWGGYKSGPTLRYIFTTDSVRVPTTNLARLQLDDGAFVGLGVAKGRIEFNDLATDTVNILDADVGIGTSTPTEELEIKSSTATAWLNNTSSGDSALTKTMSGLQLSAASMNTTVKFTGALKFMSTDPQFTTENPKFLSAIVGRATETYNDDTKGGMALDFATTPNAPGAASVPVVRFTIDENGNGGFGTILPLLDVGTAAGDFSGTGLHVKGSGATNFIVEGDSPKLFLADSAGACGIG